MDEKNKQLLDQILKYAAERKIQIPADIVLKLSTIYAEDLYSELKQGQAPSETEGKILMGTLRKLVEQIVLEEIPEFGLMNPGLVPAPGRSGLMLMSTGWKPYLMPSAPGGGGGGGTGISDAPGDSQSYVRYNRTWIVMPPGVTQHSLLTGLDYASAGHTGFQPTLTFPLSPTLGGTGIANLAASTLTLGAATSITGGGTLGLGGFTGSVPATGTFAMGAGTLTSSTTNDVTGATHTHAITKAPALVGNSGPGPLILTSSPLGVPAWSGYYLSGTTGGITTLAITADKTLTLTATDDRNITFPITGTAAIGAGTLTAATTNDVTVNAHTHAITASTALVAAGTAQYQVLTTGANPYPAGWSGFYLDGTTGGKTILAVTNTKTLTLTAADSYNLTIPATGTVALGTGTASYVGYWSGTNILTGAATFTYQTGASPNLLIQSANAAHKPVVIRGAVTQTEVLLETQLSSGNPLLRFRPNGQITYSNDCLVGGVNNLLVISSDTLQTGGISMQGGTQWNKGAFFEFWGESMAGIGGYADIGYGSAVATAAKFRVRFNSAGTLYTKLTIDNSGNVGIGTVDAALTAKLQLIGTADAQQLIVDANATQTTNISEWRTSAAVVKASLTPQYNFTATNYLLSRQVLTYAAAIAWDLDAGAQAMVTLTGNATISNPTHIRPGGRYVLKIIQDTTGNRKITSWGDLFQWSGNALPTLSTAANGIDIFGFISDGTYLYSTANYADQVPLFFEDEIVALNDEAVYL